MANVYGPVNKVGDISKINRRIREDIRRAKSERALSELYKRSAFLISLSYTPAWAKKFGRVGVNSIRTRAKNEFNRTSILINKKSRSLGINKRYDTRWG